MLQGQAEKVVLLDRACQEDACQQGPAATCMQYVWQAGSRIIAGCLWSAESYAPFMDGVNKQKAAGTSRELLLMHYHELVRERPLPAAAVARPCTQTAMHERIEHGLCGVQASMKLTRTQVESFAGAAQSFLETMLLLQKQRASCLAALCEVLWPCAAGSYYAQPACQGAPRLDVYACLLRCLRARVFCGLYDELALSRMQQCQQHMLWAECHPAIPCAPVCGTGCRMRQLSQSCLSLSTRPTALTSAAPPSCTAPAVQPCCRGHTAYTPPRLKTTVVCGV